MAKNANILPQILPQILPKYICELCNRQTNNKKDYNIHILTAKHARLTNANANTNANPIKEIISIEKDNSKCYTCLCGKEYKHKPSLCKHKKICVFNNDNKNNDNKNNDNKNNDNDHYNIVCNTGNNQNIILQLLKDNSEFKGLIMDQNQKLIDIILENNEFKTMLMEIASKTNNTTNNTTNTTNSHNKQFNLNVFLNETCKDAMNMTEFIDSLVIKNSELEDMGKLGYVRGISNIFIRALNELDENMRPIHCTDLKREIIYIKDNNIWTKETPDNLKIKKIIKYIADKNFRRIPKWRLDNPDSDDIMSKKNTDYMMMLSQVMTGITPDDDTGINKIIRNVAHHVYLDKKNSGSL